jgi:hypothetical protein
MPHPRAPSELVGGTENLSIEAASYPRNWDRVKRAAPVVADVMMPSLVRPPSTSEVARRPSKRRRKDIAGRLPALFARARNDRDPHALAF